MKMFDVNGRLIVFPYIYLKFRWMQKCLLVLGILRYTQNTLFTQITFHIFWSWIGSSWIDGPLLTEISIASPSNLVLGCSAFIISFQLSKSIMCPLFRECWNRALGWLCVLFSNCYPLPVNYFLLQVSHGMVIGFEAFFCIVFEELFRRDSG